MQIDSKGFEKQIEQLIIHKVISGLNSGKRKKEIQVLGKFSKHSRDLAMNIVT
jgi:hypothetical protein